MRNRLPLLSTAFGLSIAVVAAGTCGAAAPAPTLNTLINFKGTNGSRPEGGLAGDALGNLFGTTSQGGANANKSVCGANGCGTLFEVVNRFGGYDNTPTVLYNFCSQANCTDGANPLAGMIADINGNLYGTTSNGGANVGTAACGMAGCGTVFELARIPNTNSYAKTPTILLSFDGTHGLFPFADLTMDANGNLFGTTEGGGANNQGTVFELTPPTSVGGQWTETVLWSFTGGADGAQPVGGLLLDADGNLFGTATRGGINQNGTVFEIKKSGNGYATVPTLLVAFLGPTATPPEGRLPNGNLIFDGDGNLFGVTKFGGAGDEGTVYKLAKSPQGGFKSTPTTLATLGGGASAEPQAGVIIDRQGNLFGTSTMGGMFSASGTVFEIAKNATGDDNTPIILVNFHGAAGLGAFPTAGLIADRMGNLFGTTLAGGTVNNANSTNGTVFEVINSGFKTSLVFAGTPGTAHCYGESVLALRHEDRNLDVAAQALGLDNAEALQAAILQYCVRRAP